MAIRSPCSLILRKFQASPVATTLGDFLIQVSAAPGHHFLRLFVMEQPALLEPGRERTAICHSIQSSSKRARQSTTVPHYLPLSLMRICLWLPPLPSVLMSTLLEIQVYGTDNENGVFITVPSCAGLPAVPHKTIKGPQNAINIISYPRWSCMETQHRDQSYNKEFDHQRTTRRQKYIKQQQSFPGSSSILP